MRRASKQRPIEGNYREWADLAAYREDARRARRRLQLLRSPGPRAAGISLFSAMRNECDRLPRFLDHYRALGVARFVIVDNGSSDGSRELLLDQPDVELHHTADSYADANAGTLWIDGLMGELADDRWVLYADADELLVYDGSGDHPLPVLAERLTARGERNLLAPLLDLYPHPRRPDQLMFDAAPEPSRTTRHGRFIQGGPRYRMAAAIGSPDAPCLTKYPFARYDARTAFANAHFPCPTEANGDRICGRLLHLKINAQFRSKVAEALREGQHWNDGAEYRGYARWLDQRDPEDLLTGVSRGYTGPGDLIDAGLLEPLDWHRANAGVHLGAILRRLWPRRRR